MDHSDRGSGYVLHIDARKIGGQPHCGINNVGNSSFSPVIEDFHTELASSLDCLSFIRLTGLLVHLCVRPL